MRERIGKFSKITGAALLALVLSGVGLVAPAQAQFFGFWGRRPLPWQQGGIGRSAVSAIVDQHGMRLLRPVHRNGNVYVADTEDHFGHSFRLIIDASNGRVLEMFTTSHEAAAQHQHHKRPVRARVHVKQQTHTKPATTPLRSERKARSRANIPVEAAMPAPVAQPATAAIIPAAAKVIAAKVVTPKVVAPQPRSIPAKVAPIQVDRKINDVPVAPLD